jgi:hypothetical protein
MRIPRFRALLLAGLLGLARTVDAAAAADPLADALAASQALAKLDQNDPSFEPEIRQVESRFILLLRQSPDDPRIVDAVDRFYAGGPWSSRVPAPALLDLVSRSADPVRLAMRLTRTGYYRASAEILFAALDARPEAAVLWRRAAQLTYDPAWKIALLEEALRQKEDATVSTVMAEDLLQEQLAAGLVPQALATFQGLAPEVRSRVEQGSEGEVKTRAGGLPFTGWTNDLRLPLAQAYLLAGDARAAARLAAKVKPVPATKRDRSSGRWTRELARRVVARWLHPSREDPFKLLADALADERFGLGTLALARLAERERYPAVAAYVLSFLGRDRREPPLEPARGVLPRVRAAAESTQGEIEKLHQSLEEEIRADQEAARTALGPDPAAATVDRLLSAPTTAPFTERPLPEGIAPVELGGEEVESRRREMVAGLELPAGFCLVRAERQGDRVAAIGESQDYDPLGEVSAGAYWVLLSSDGGRTWGPPLYTGLRLNQPYVVRAVSRLPLLAGDHLQVEVEIAELDASRITFPPVLLTPKRTAKGLYLDIPLELLQKDSDGDGLTDLAEERLLTDPRSRDTDGDGLEDGVDPLPHAPFQRAAPSAQERALAAFLADTWNVDRAAILEGIPAGPGALCCARGGVRSVDQKTLFLVADRGLFAALSPAHRVVVLTPEETAAAQKKFGPFFPQSLELFVLDRSGRRAYAIWSSGWQGGQTLLEERADGTWKATRTTGWIT